ncbi:hypothetical protein ACP70R_004682 [Stipagrostis hirtigluma subsp. patula]
MRGLARLFAPFAAAAAQSIDDLPKLEVPGGRQYRVEVYSTEYGETAFGTGWFLICHDLGVKPGNVAVVEGTAAADRFLIRFYDGFGNERLAREPNADVLPLQLNPRPRGPGTDWWRAARASGSVGGERASQGDPTARAIEEAMDLVVRSGAMEGSDEYYMATKLLVSAENRAMFYTFKTSGGRLDWLRRCYQDRKN